ncbi:hypothetical protein [Kitasatospora purpeofusca]|uniref:NarG-like domain-containing protein n=1 Tax=Kitasatospora purpeofusca TaxID=67352 RepID=A0ABZ1U589_9ACTN|nr:hypothetical protein [Kitasatospora purpeofusca]
MRSLPLALFYYAVVSPVGLAARLFHDPLRRRWRRQATSYFQLPAGGRS